MAQSPEVSIRISVDGSSVKTGISQAEQHFDGLKNHIDSIERSSAALTSSISRMGHATVAAFSIQGMAQAADAWTNLESRIKISTGSVQEAGKAIGDVFRIAQKSGQDLSSVGDIYQKLSRNARQYGMDQSAVAGVTQDIANAMKLSGASAESASAALMQFGQALSSGQLRGEELNSVLEQAPALAEAIARGMGKTTGELKKMGEDGLLPVKSVLQAIRSESARLEEEAGSMANTISASVQRLKNAFDKFSGTEGGALASGIASGINMLADNLDNVARAAAATGVALAGMKLSSYVAEIRALIVAKEALIAAELASAAAAATAARAQVSKEAATIASKVAVDALTAAEVRLAAAMNAAAAGPLMGALIAYGPIIAAVAAAAGAGAVVWKDWKDMADLAAAATDNASASARKLANDLSKAVTEVGTMTRAAYNQQMTQSLLDREKAAKAAAAAQEKLDKFTGNRVSDEFVDISTSAAKAKVELGQIDANLQKFIDSGKRVGQTHLENYYDKFGSSAQKAKDEIEKLNKAHADQVQRMKQDGASKSQLAEVEADYQRKLTELRKKGAGSEKDDYTKIIEALREKIATEEAALGTSEKLTAGEKYALKVMVDLRDGTLKLTDAQKQATAAALERYLVAEKANTAEQKAAEARKILLHFEEETSKIKVGTAGIDEQIRQLETYGVALKENALASAQAAIAELHRKGVYDQVAEAARMAAAAERQIADMQLSITERNISLNQEALAAISANYANQIEVERSLVEAKKQAELQKINLSVTSAEVALKAAEANGSATDKMRADYAKLVEAAKGARKTIEDIAAAKLKGLDTKEKDNAFDRLSASAEKFRKGLGGVVTALNTVQKARDDSRYANDATGNQQLQDQISSYATLTSSIKVMFKEKSDGYKALEAVEKGLLAAQTVLNTATAVGAVLNQGKGDPYSSWVRMAAMAAAVAAMGFSTGFIGGGGKDSAAAVAAQQASQGTGTVLGDAAKQSESISKSLELLGKVDTMTMKYSSQMAASLRNIENNIGGFATMLFRSTSATSGNLPGLKLAPSYSTLQDYAGKITPGLNLDDQTNQMVDRLGADGTTSWLNPVGVDFTTQSGDMFGTPDVKALIMTERLQNATAGKLGIELPGVFESLTRSITAWVYGKVSQSIVNSGLDLGTGSVSAYANREVDLRQFATVETKKSQAFGLVKSSSTSNAYAPLDDEFTRQIGTIFSNLSLTLNAAAGALGEDTAKVGAEISSHIVSLGQISLKDMPLDKSIEAISAVLSTAFDKAASATFSQLTDFQQVGEGFYETVMRVATGVESAKVALERAGVSAINYSEIINKQGNVAEQVARQSISAKEGLSGIGALISGISGTASELVSVYTALLDLRAAMSGIGLAAADVTHDMIRGAGSLDALSSGFNDYLKNYFTDAEQLSAKTKMVSEQFSRLGVSMPSSRAAFVSMVNGLDRTTESGQRTFGVLMSLAGAFNEIMPAASSATAAVETATEKASRIASERAGLEQEYMQLVGDTARLRRQELEALDESNRALKERIWAIEDARAAEAAAKTALSAAFSRLQESVNAEKQRISTDAEQRKSAINTQLSIQQEAYRVQISAAQDAANEIKSIASALSSAVKQTQIDSVLLDKQRLDAARGIIDQAFAGNNIKLPGLTDALTVAGEDSKKFYGTFEAYAFEQGVTNAKIKNLSGTADAQLSAAEQMIKSLEASSAAAQVIAKAQLDAIDTQTKDQQDALDAQLKQGEDQMNALLGIDKSVLSVADAVKGLAAAMAGYSAAQASALSAARSLSSSVSGGGGGGSSSTTSTSTSSQPTSFAGNWWDSGAGWLDASTNTWHANVEKSPWYAGPNGADSLDYKTLQSIFGANNVPNTAVSQAYGGALSAADWDKVRASSNPADVYQSLFNSIVGTTAATWASSGENGVAINDRTGGTLSVLVGPSLYENAANATNFWGVSPTGEMASVISSGIVTAAVNQFGAGTENTGMAIYEQAASLGLSASQIAEATGQSVESINAWIDQRGLASLDGSHATGLESVPFDGYRAELHKGEAVVSAPEVAAIRRYFGANVGGGASGNAELSAALRDLADRLDRIEANTRATAGHSAGTNRKLDRVIRNDSVIVEIAA